jgi:hypothetical protein
MDVVRALSGNLYRSRGLLALPASTGRGLAHTCGFERPRPALKSNLNVGTDGGYRRSIPAGGWVGDHWGATNRENSAKRRDRVQIARAGSRFSAWVVEQHLFVTGRREYEHGRHVHGLPA